MQCSWTLVTSRLLDVDVAQHLDRAAPTAKLGLAFHFHSIRESRLITTQRRRRKLEYRHRVSTVRNDLLLSEPVYKSYTIFIFEPVDDS